MEKFRNKKEELEFSKPILLHAINSSDNASKEHKRSYKKIANKSASKI